MQKLANVRSTAAHLFKPRLGEPSQLVIRLGKPSINAGVLLSGARESQEFAHQTSKPLIASIRFSADSLSRYVTLITSHRAFFLAISRHVTY